MDANHFSYEIIFVNDGSTDRSWNVIEELGKSNPEVKGIKFRRNYGNRPPCTAGSNGQKAMWSLPWMPTCKTVRRNSGTVSDDYGGRV